MSEQSIVTNSKFNSTTLLGIKSIGLLVLLMAEVLAITIRFDSRDLSLGGRWVGVLADYVSAVPQILAVVLTATLIFGGQEVSNAITKFSQCLEIHPRCPVWLAIHLSLLVSFGITTQFVFEVNRGASGAWLLLWVFLGVACIGAWLAAAIQPSIWSEIGRRLFGPIFFGTVIGLAGWFAGQLATQYWQSLSYWTFQTVGLLLYTFGLTVLQEIELFEIGTPVFSVRIAPACSGYEGMGLAVVFITTYLWWRRRDHIFPRSLLLIPISIVLMFLANAVRIAGLIFIGHWGWSDFALGGFHSQAGWFAFNFVVLGLVAFARVSPYFCRRILAVKEPVVFQAIPMLTPFIVLTLTIMVTGAIQSGFDWLYPIRFLTVLLSIACLAKRVHPSVWTWNYCWTGPCFGIAVYSIWVALEPFNADVPSGAMIAELQTQSPILIGAWFVFRVLGSVVTVPIAEELAFRGYLLPWLSGCRVEQNSRPWPWLAILLSSVAFGVLHPGRWIAGTLAGILYAIAYYRRGLLMDAVIAHATTNALIAVHVLSTSNWTLWN